MKKKEASLARIIIEAFRYKSTRKNVTKELNFFIGAAPPQGETGGWREALGGGNVGITFLKHGFAENPSPFPGRCDILSLKKLKGGRFP